MEVKSFLSKNWRLLLELPLMRQPFSISKQTLMGTAQCLSPNSFPRQLLRKHNRYLGQLLQFVDLSLNLLSNHKSLSNNRKSLPSNHSNHSNSNSKVGINSNKAGINSNNKAGINSNNRVGTNLSNHCKMFSQRFVQASYAEGVELALTLIGDSVRYAELKIQFVD